MNHQKFLDQVYIVTGAASGIGRATAIAFSKQGAKVIVADTLADQGLQTVHLIKEGDGDAHFVKCDVSSEEDVKNMVSETVRVYGKVNGAFNNAGIEGDPASTVDCSIKNWDRTLSINLKGTWLCMKYEIPELLKQSQKGAATAIVNNASIAGLVGFQNIPAYSASKHGVIGLTKSAALEYAKSNLRINAVCPGVIQTPMIDRFTKGDPAAHAALASGEPMGRVGQPEEIASAVLWLCSEGASFVTGHSLVVDGGWVAQ